MRNKKRLASRVSGLVFALACSVGASTVRASCWYLNQYYTLCDCPTRAAVGPVFEPIVFYNPSVPGVYEVKVFSDRPVTQVEASVELYGGSSTALLLSPWPNTAAFSTLSVTRLDMGSPYLFDMVRMASGRVGIRTRLTATSDISERLFDLGAEQITGSRSGGSLTLTTFSR